MALSTKRPSRRGPPGSRESWNWGTEPPRGGAFPAGACRWPPPFRKVSGCSSQWFHPGPFVSFSFHSSRCLPVSPAVTSVTPSPDPLSGFNLGDPVGRPHSACTQRLCCISPHVILSPPCHSVEENQAPSLGVIRLWQTKLRKNALPFFYFSQVSCSSDWSRTFYVDTDALILQPSRPKCWDSRYATLSQVFEGLGIGSRREAC